ncbi:MAG: hypothetical protein ABFD07_16470 [Methanobacterium sp.]
MTTKLKCYINNEYKGNIEINANSEMVIPIEWLTKREKALKNIVFAGVVEMEVVGENVMITVRVITNETDA